FIEHRAPLHLDGHASIDPDAGPQALRYEWRLIARPLTSALSSSAIRNANESTASITPDVDGAYLCRLTVSDGDKSDARNVLLRYAKTDSPSAVEAPTPGVVIVTPVPPTSDAARRANRTRPPDFTLAVTPAELPLGVGGENAFTVTLRARGSTAAVARLSVS